MDEIKRVCINRIATAVPEHDVHQAFVSYAEKMLADRHVRALFMRMAGKAEIEHRFSPMYANGTKHLNGTSAYDVYRSGEFPSTAERMKLFERFAPKLATKALDNLALSSKERDRIRHVIVTCCTGLYAPGLDFAAIDYLGLPHSTERTMIGFMGCYAAINGLKQARHIVRSEPGESVLLLNLELCTIHLQETQDLNEVLSFLIFGDGCAASLISSEGEGLEIDGFRATQIEGTRELITWRVGDGGFDMVLSGQVPREIAQAMRAQAGKFTEAGPVDMWAVHPGGRTVLDAVQKGLALRAEALWASRKVLSEFGNMSSATVMFVLKELMKSARSGQRGCAMSFGPGLTAETMRFHAI
ncbi:MAG TPA: type III polyketide synthase [Silvibacterium sp.]|nr:type III polyketide synthase [Silvibacterium sp.]